MQQRQNGINLANFNNNYKATRPSNKLPETFSLAGDKPSNCFYYPEQKGVSFNGNKHKNFHAPVSFSLGSSRIPSAIFMTPIQNTESIQFVGLKKPSFFVEKKSHHLTHFNQSTREPSSNLLFKKAVVSEKSRWGNACADTSKTIVKKVGIKLLDKAKPGLGRLADGTLSTQGVANANVKYQKEAELLGRDRASIAACSFIRATTESNVRKLGYKAIAPFVSTGLASGPGGWAGLGVAALGVELAANEAGKLNEQSCYEAFSKKPLTLNLR